MQSGALKDKATNINFEKPLTVLVWLTSIVSIALTFVVSYLLDPGARRRHAVVEAQHHHQLRHAGRRDHPGADQGLHLDRVEAREEVVTSSREGGASLNILSGLTAGNFSAVLDGHGADRA